jgi:sarcosine oxidase subunit gamma
MSENLNNSPTNVARRSPLYRYHESRKAQFVGRSESVLVNSYPEDEELGIKQAQSLAIFDLTGVSRLGFKGVDTSSWLSNQNISLPERPNEACISREGLTVARLSDHEYLMLDPVASENSKLRKLRNNLSMNIGIRSYLLERADSHGCFALTGSLAAQVLSKVCAVDMRPHKFDQFNVAQTFLARVNSIVIRLDQGDTLCFFILADLSTNEFLWEGLLDAMQEFCGKPMGVSTLNSLL